MAGEVEDKFGGSCAFFPFFPFLGALIGGKFGIAVGGETTTGVGDRVFFPFAEGIATGLVLGFVDGPPSRISLLPGAVGANVVGERGAAGQTSWRGGPKSV